MPRENRFRRSSVISPARRRLFGDSDPVDLDRRLQNELDTEMRTQSERWGFDFRRDVPINCATAASSSSSTSTEGPEANFVYETLNSSEVPMVYRPNTIIRTEVQNYGVLEIKTYPTDTSLTSPTKTIIPVESKSPGRKRHLPTPSKSPMKLRKRESPQKTPINPGPKPTTSSSSANSKRPRRNLSDHFKPEATTLASAVPTSSSSSTSKK